MASNKGLPGLTILLRNTINSVNRGDYTPKSLQEDYEYTVQRLNDLLSNEKTRLLKQSNCDHEYSVGRYTMRRNVMGNYRKVHERDCLKCGKKDIFVEYEDSKDSPEWTKDTMETYYNNSI